MSVTVDHIAIPSREPRAAADFLGAILGLGPSVPDGPDDNHPEDPENGQLSDPLGGLGRVYFSTPEGHLFEVAA